MTESATRRRAAQRKRACCERQAAPPTGAREGNNLPLLARKRPCGVAAFPIDRTPSDDSTITSLHGTQVDNHERIFLADCRRTV
jgi:hypothetical protein